MYNSRIQNNKNKYRVFVVPRNGKVLLGMSDTEAFNIIKINVDSLGAEDARHSEWCGNTHTLSWNLSQNRKYTELRSAAQTWTAVQN